MTEVQKMKELPKYEINKEMVFSSSHIPESTAKLLECGDAPFSVTSNDYSWRLHVSKYAAVHDVEGNTELKNIAKIAKEHDCIWLVIDQDGPIYTNLPIFNW